jgi:gliding motility-associated-like protein
MKQLYLRLLATVGILFGSVHVEAQYSSVAQLSAGSDINLGCNVNCFTLQSSLTDIKATTTYTIDSSLAFAGNYGFNIGGATQIASVDEIFSGAVSLPFDFCFYGNTYNQLTIGTNGAINFGSANAYQLNYGLITNGIPSADYPAGTILAAMQDLDVSEGGSIHYDVSGTYPTRKFIINYYQVPQKTCLSQTVTMQVVLYETTNVIELYIKDKPVCGTQNSGNAISGLQATSSSALPLPGKNNTNWGSNNMNKAYRFIPNGTSSVSAVKLKDLLGNILAATAATPSTPGQLEASFANVCLTANSETYVVSATYYQCNGDSVVMSDTMTANKLVIPLPVPQAGLYYCQGATNATALTATGSNLLWYTTLTGGTGVSSITPSTAVAGTYKYYVSQTISGCESLRDSVTVTVGVAGAGYTASSNTPVCQNGDINLYAPTVPGANYVWTGPSGYFQPVQNPTLTFANFPNAGTYTLAVQNPSGCADFSTTTTVSIIAGPTIGSMSVVHPTMCEGFDDGQIKLTGSPVFNASTPYQVYITKDGVPQPVDTFTTSGINPYQLTITGLGGGVYTAITIKEFGGCMSNEAGTAILNSITAPPVTSSSTNPAGCGPMANGTITIHGLTHPYNYTINYEYNGVSQPPQLLTANPSGDVIITNLAGGIYTNITATRLGCTTDPEGPISLAIPPTPVVTPTTNAPVCGGDTILLFGASTIGTVTWNWTGPASFSSTLQNPIRTNSIAAYSGLYTLTAFNTATLCTSDPVSIEVIVKPVPATPIATSNSPLCSGQTLNLQASGSGVGVTYNWNGPNSFSSTTQNPSITNVTTANAGNYGVYASKDGCTSVGTATVSVSVTTTPNIDSTQFTNPSTCGGSNGSIRLYGLAASTTYTISFTKNGTPQTPQSLTSNGSGMVTIAGLTQGTYTNIIASSGSCSSNIMGPVVLADPPTPATPTAGNNGPLCSGQTLNLTASSATPGVTYSWSGPSSYSSGQQNPSISNIQTTNAGTYTVVASINGCNSAPATTTVTVNQTPTTPVATSNSPICAGSTLNLFSTTITGTYSWTGPNSFSSALEDPSIASATTAATGTYTVNVTENGCTSANATVAVVVNAVPAIAGTTFSDPTTCGGSNGTITLTGLVAGSTYTVNYDKNGVPATPVNITANGSGNVIITGLTQGVYSNITVTINGCISNVAAAITLTDPAAPVITASSNSPICEDATLNLSVTTVPGGTYSWSGPSSFSSTAQNPSIAGATPANSGTYTVIANLNNCFDTATTTVTVHPTPATPVITTNSPVCSGNNLTLNTAAVSGGSYNWWGPNSFTSTSQNNTITSATTAATGTYNLAVSVNGCISDTATASVTVFLTPNIASTTPTNPSTCGGSNGSITLNGLPASTTFTVTYTKNGTPQSGSITTNGSGVGTISGLTQGLYDLIQVSANGCSSNVAGPVTLTDPGAPVITASNNGPICEGDTISLSVTTVPGGTYAWSGPVSYTSSTQNPNILNATPANSGTYTVIAGVNNCYDTATTTVTVHPTPATPVITTNSPVCTGNTLTLNTAAVSGGTYNWWGPNSWTSTTQNNSITSVTLVANGIYNLVVSVNGCPSDTGTATVVINETPNIASTSSTNPTTCGGSDGTITLNGLIASTTFTVNYTKNGIPQSGSITSNGSGVGVITGLTQGTYANISVTVNGCSSNTAGPITLTDPAAPVITASNNGPICEGDTLSLSVTTIGGASYVWSGPVSFTSGIQNPDIMNATPANSGTYTVIAGLNNCYDTATTVATIYATPATPVITTNSPVCSGNTLTLNTTTVSGGSYNWWGPNSWTSTTQNNSIASVTTAASGIYNLVVSVNGCLSDTGTATVVINQTPNITSTSFTDPTTCLGADGTISLLGLNNNTTYAVNYTFNGTPQSTSLTSNGSGILTITGLTAGSYTNISVTLLGCQSNMVGPITLTDPAAPVITASNNTPICESDTVEFTVTTIPGATYTWSGPGSFSSGLQNPTIPNATPTNNGVYTVIATVNNCSDTATTTVLVNPTPATPVAGSNSPVCSGDVLNLTAGNVPGATYNWWGPNSFSSTTQNPSISNVTVAATGTYYVTATVTGCVSDTGSTVVVVNPTPQIDSATFTNPTTCGGSDGTITLHGLTATTTYTVDYDQDGTPQTQSVTTNGSGQGTITGLPAGTYTNITASLNNCTSNAVGPIVLVDPNAPTPPTVANNGPLCPGDTLLLTASSTPGATYNWWGPNSFSSTQQNPVILNAQAINAGIYYVTMTVANCTSDTASTTVIINATPATPVATSNSPVCTGNDINLFSSTVSGATYTWSGPNSFSSNLQNPVITNAQAINAGDYILTVSINNCASAADTVTVTVNETPVIADTAHTDPTVCGGTDGTITLMGLLNNTSYTVNFNHNGTPQTPITITSNGSGDVVMTGLSNGTYGAISVTLNGCTSDTVGMFTIYNPPPISIAASNGGTICEGDTIFLFATSVPGATYVWNGPAGYTSNDQNPVITPTTAANAGTYTVTATALGCNSTDTTTITIIATPQTPVASSNSPVCEGSDINLFATTVSGATYSWSGPNSYNSSDQNPVISNATAVMAGQYIVSVTGNGCLSGSDTVDVVINPTPVITDTAHTDPTTCNGNDGTITLEGLVTGTTYDVYYQLNGTNNGPSAYTANGSGNVVITGLGAGTYDSIYVNLGGCISNYMGPITLVDPTAPMPPVAGSNSPVCEGDTIFLTASTVVGATYQWTGPGGYSSNDQNPVIAPATAADAGQYSVTVTVANCTSDPDTVDVIVNPTPALPVAGSNSPICEGEDLNLTATTVPGGIYNWTGPNSWTSTDQNPVIANVTTADAGQYIVTVTSTGCTSGADTVDVVINPTPVIADTAYTHPTTCMGTDGTITLEGLGNNTTYTVTYYQNGVLQTATITSDGSGNVVITGLGAGTYDTISVVMSPCASVPVGPIVLTDPGAPAMPVASSNTPICEGDSILLFATTVPGGVTYTWNGPGGYTSNDQNPVITPATPGNAGTYTVTATLNNCTSAGSTTTVVINPTPAMATAGSNSPVCEGDTIFLTATTVTGATYTWNGPNGWTSTDQNPIITPATAADAGIYSVTTGLGVCGSDTSFTTVVINPTPAPPTAGSNSPVCEGQALNLTATTVPGATYNWTSTTGFTSTDQNPVIDPTTINDAGTYYVTATGGGCTSGMDSVVVVIDTLPDMPIAAASTPLCEGDTLYLTATTVNGATYTWNGPNGWNSTDQNPVIYNVTTAHSGQYTVFATTNGCGSGIDTVDVVVNPASVIAGHSYTDPSTCAGTDGTITLNGFTPGDTYTITYLQNGNPVTITITADISGNLVITGLSAGTYANLEVATVAGCMSSPLATVVLADPNAPATPAAGSNSPVCEGQQIDLTANGSTTGTYNWTSTTGFTSNTQNPTIAPATPADAGTYYVSVTENGCTSGVDSVVVVVNPIAAPPVAGSNSPVCEGDNIELTASTTTSGVNYIWWGPNSYGSTQQNPVISPATPADAGTYYVTADLGGCNSDTASVTVVVNPTPVIGGTSSTDPTVCNGTDGTITLTGLTPGTAYDVTYLQNGNPVGPVTIVADVNGDVIITGLSAGSYTGLTSASGLCGDTVSSTITLVDPNAPTAPVVNNNGPLCEGNTLVLTSSITGLTYTWTGPNGWSSSNQDDSILNVTAVNAGTYTLVVSQNGCSAAAVTTTVVINPTPAAPVASSNSPLCEGSDLTLFATTVAGATYTWTGPSFSSTDQNPVITGATAANAGWYYVYTSFGSCVSTMDSINVSVNPIPNPPTVVSPVVYCEGDVASVLTATGTNLQWYTQSQGGTALPTAPLPNTSTIGSTWYYVSQSMNGCESNRDSIEVIVNPKPLPPAVISPVNFCQGEPASPLTATGTNLLWYTSPTGGTGSATAPTPNTSVIGQTVYYVSQTAGSCESDRDSIVVNVLPGAQAPAIGGPVMYCQYGPALPDIATYVVGTNLMWYTTATGGTGSSTAPVISTNTAMTDTFWVSQGNGACESGRYPIIVIVSARPNPPFTLNLNYCQNAPAVPLGAGGQNLLWYSSQTGGSGTTTAPTPQTATPGSTTYWVSQTVNGCESDRAPITVYVAPTPAAPIINQFYDYCQFEPTVQLQPSGGTILWYTTATGGTGSPTGPIPNTDQPGVYQWWVTTNVEGCESERAMVTVTVFAKPPAPATTPVNYCQGQIATPLVAAGQNLTWYSSSTGGSGTTATPTPLTGTPGVTTYYVSQTINGCESNRAPLQVTVYQNITANFSISKDKVCREDTASVVYTGTTVTGATYVWNFGGADIVSGSGSGPYVLTWPTSGNHTISVTVNNGTCSDSKADTIEIVEAPDASFVMQNDACLGEIVKVQPDYHVMGQEGEYKWNFSGAEIISGSGDGYYALKWTTPGLKIVTLVVQGTFCPSQPFRDTIKVHEKPIAKIENEIHYNICSGDTISLSAYYNTNYTYEWGPERAVGELNDGAEVSAKIEKPMFITLHVYDDYGCSNADSIHVNSQPCCNVWLPNAFTPNGDGRNDIFRLMGDGHIELATFAIRNRFGQVVFETANQYEPWDGRFNGQMCDVGTYFYFLRYKCGDKTVEKKGDITLIR